MILYFNDFVHINENTNSEINIGDYVILKSKRTNIKNIPPWENLYGRVIEKNDIFKDIFLIKLLCYIDSTIQGFIKNQTNYNFKNINDDTLIVNVEYLQVFKNKKEFDKEIDKIKFDNIVKKYNL